MLEIWVLEVENLYVIKGVISLLDE